MVLRNTAVPSFKSFRLGVFVVHTHPTRQTARHIALAVVWCQCIDITGWVTGAAESRLKNFLQQYLNVCLWRDPCSITWPVFWHTSIRTQLDSAEVIIITLLCLVGWLVFKCLKALSSQTGYIGVWNILRMAADHDKHMIKQRNNTINQKAISLQPRLCGDTCHSTVMLLQQSF